MTDQVPDTVWWEDKQYLTYDELLAAVFDALRPPIRHTISNSACWRGYIATWKISNDRLFLTELFDCNGDNIDFQIDDLFPDSKNFVFAKWFSGKLHLIVDSGANYENFSKTDPSDQRVTLNVKAGRIVKESTLSPRAFRGSGFDKRLVSVLWRTLALVVATVIGLIAANTLGWNGGIAFFGRAAYPTLLGVLINDLAAAVGGLGCILVGYLVLRVAKWFLWVLVPMMLYSALVAGLWNGIGSDFDATRLAVLQHGYANAYALRHMHAHAFQLTCHDARVALTEDAKTLCATTAPTR